MDIIEKIISNFKNNKSLYIGEKVTIAEHMIQSAMMAEKSKSKDYLVCSCLLHDYGHFIIENPDLLVSKLLDGKHEYLAFKFLSKYFKPDVVEPIKLHVQAKRYLCRDNSYFKLLSKASKISLKLQGGVMSDKEAKKFTSLKFHNDAIMLRKYDDDGKVPDLKIKKIDYYRDLINSQLINWSISFF